MAVAPRSAHLVVSGFPDNEGNAVEALRACAERYPGRVIWLAADRDGARGILVAAQADPDRRVEILPHRSFRGVWAFVTAEASMFTHGLYGNPRRVRRKTMVNLWHGGGFKGSVMSDARGRPSIWSDYLVASSEQFGRARARECALPDDGLLLTGNPRIDQFARSPTAPLDRIGLSHDRPFVLWMPTFRKNMGYGMTSGWSEVEGGAVDVNAVMAEGVAILRMEFDITVVVKPHPQDAESRRIPGALIVTNDDLAAAGLQLYEVIGASSGLLTDYSSVWIDYLALDRPIGFVVPDEEGYTRGRGFDPPDALDWLPGPRVRSLDDVRAFGDEVLSGGLGGTARRREVAEHIGHVASAHVAHRVLDLLEERNVFSAPLGSAPLPPTDALGLPGPG